MDKIDATLIGVSLLILIMFLCFGLFKGQNELKDFKKQAIENGAAHYIVDNDGNVTFEWITK